ncbi:M28 family peptidase [Breznakiellaceae bacterium SP9]
MHADSWSTPPYHRFQEFIAPNADRFAILKSLLAELRFESNVINLKGCKHFFVFSHGQNPLLMNNPINVLPVTKKIPRTVLAAHYDRVQNSPGANDNSAAVFELIEAGLRLRQKDLRDWLIIFTDKEELGRGESIASQGSYTLGTFLKELGLGRIQVFIFDACGCGDSLIISTLADYLFSESGSMNAEIFRKKARLMRQRALNTARHLNMEKVLLVPTPFSDDAGFLRSGIIAQTITMLPSNEAAVFASRIRNKPDFPAALINRDKQDTHVSLILPETWRVMNGPADSFQRLTPEHFKQVVRFAWELCE